MCGGQSAISSGSFGQARDGKRPVVAPAKPVWSLAPGGGWAEHVRKQCLWSQMRTLVERYSDECSTWLQ